MTEFSFLLYTVDCAEFFLCHRQTLFKRKNGDREVSGPVKQFRPMG